MVKQKQFSIKEIKIQRIEALKKLRLPFLLFSLASIVLAGLLPSLLAINHTQPTILQLSVIGIVVILITALFIWWSSRILKLSAAWMIMVTFFLSIVAIIKFIIVPQSLYSQTYSIGNGNFLSSNFDPNVGSSYFFVSISVFLVYALIFWLYYRTYRRKVIMSQHRTGRNNKAVESSIKTAVVIGIIILIGLFVSGALGILLLVPFLFLGGTLQYLQFVFNNGGLLLLFSLVIAAIFAFKSIQVSAHDSVEMKRPVVIVICAWIALSVLLMYQIVWIIYMTVLLTLAPFKVVYFSSK